MRGATLTFTDLSPQQVEALNATFALLRDAEHQEDLARNEINKERTARALVRDIEAAGLMPALEEVAAATPAPAHPFGIGAPVAPWENQQPASTAAPGATPLAQFPSTVPTLEAHAATSPTVQPSAPAPSAPPAPVASTAPARAPAGSPTDKEGVPHNKELHAPIEGKTGGLMQTGEWKKKRGGDKAAYDAWRAQYRTAAAAGTAPALEPNREFQAGYNPPRPAAEQPAAQSPTPGVLNAMFGAPPVNEPQAVHTNGALPDPVSFFSGAAVAPPNGARTSPEELDLSSAPECATDVFARKVNTMVREKTLTQAMAVRIMGHPQIKAKDEVDVGRDPEKRRKAFMLLEMIEAGHWPVMA